MKQLKAIIALMVITFSMNAQTIGDDLDKVIQMNPKGTFGETSDGYSYAVNGSFYNLYFFNVDKICHKICVVPNSASLRMSYVNMMNEKFEKVDNSHWNFSTDSGKKLQCSADYIVDVGTVFWIEERK